MFGLQMGKLGISGGSRLNPVAKLFAASEKGILADFTSLSNLYQDSALTTPCAAVGDPIGGVLDTSGNGKNLTQATSTKRFTLGRMPAGGVRNQFVGTTFAGAVAGTPGTPPTGWTFVLSGGSFSVPSTAVVGFTTVGARHMLNQTVGVPASAELTYSIKVVANVAGGLRYTNMFAVVNQPAGCAIAYKANGVVVDPSLYVPVPDDILQIVLTNSTTAGTVLCRFGCGTASNISGTVEFTEPQFELGSSRTSYQAVGAAYDVTESGVASVWAAYADGIDDCLVTPSIDFSGTDAITVYAGIRKTSDAARGMLVELSATDASNNGSFALTAPNAASATIAFESKGTLLTDAVATSTAPASALVTASGKTSTDTSVLRLNGVQADADTGDQGTGNYGNYPLYIGQRGAASLPYKGFISILCIRGAATDAATITAMENWMEPRAPGVVLP